MVAEAIGSTIHRLGPAECTSHMAEEFGDHPVEAAERMCWVRQLLGGLRNCLYLPTAPPAPVLAGVDLLPVRAAA